jgi:hypothetical protein
MMRSCSNGFGLLIFQDNAYANPSNFARAKKGRLWQRCVAQIVYMLTELKRYSKTALTRRVLIERQGNRLRPFFLSFLFQQGQFI